MPLSCPCAVCGQRTYLAGLCNPRYRSPSACRRIFVENPAKYDQSVSLERTAGQVPEGRISIECFVNASAFPCDVVNGLFRVEGLDRLFHFVVKDLQFTLEFGFRIECHLGCTSFSISGP